MGPDHLMVFFASVFLYLVQLHCCISIQMSYPNPMSIFENRDGSGQNPTGPERNPTQPDPSKIKNPKTQPGLTLPT